MTARHPVVRFNRSYIAGLLTNRAFPLEADHDEYVFDVRWVYERREKGVEVVAVEVEATRKTQCDP